MKKIVFFTVSICILVLTGCNSKTNIESTLKSYKWVNVTDKYDDCNQKVRVTTTLLFEDNTRGYDKVDRYYYSTGEDLTGKWGLHYYISGSTISCVYDIDPEAGTSVWPATRTLTYHDTYLTDENGVKFERK